VTSVRATSAADEIKQLTAQFVRSFKAGDLRGRGALSGRDGASRALGGNPQAAPPSFDHYELVTESS
jgi:hypothetical protein